MKKNFKKSLAVFMAMLMLLSVVGVSAMAAAYTVQFLPGRYGSGDSPESVTVEKNTTITLPDVSFTRDGYVQAGWSTITSGARKNYELGDSLKVTKNIKLYPYWEILTYDVTFAPGADGVGVAQTVEVDFGKTTNFPGTVFTREGYIQTGWTTVEGGEAEYNVTGKTPKIEGDTTFYPAWEKCNYSVETNVSTINYGNVCVGYSVPAVESLIITNAGNMPLEYTLPSVPNYDIKVTSGSLELEKGESVTIAIVPMSGLAAADYSANFVFDCNYDVSDVNVAVTFVVNEHSFDRYTSNNDATYEADGTKTAVCSNGCGIEDIIVDIGSMKIYSADNNTVDGLLEEYIYHKTIRVTAYGSGTDNIQEDGSIAVGTKRFRPVSWYVNDEFNGEFANDNYDINFVHTSFGDYTLKIKYVEEEYVCVNEEDGTCEWVATGEEDEKSFDYYVGPSAKEEQEVVRPNMIVNIIFGIFAKLFELLFG